MNFSRTFSLILACMLWINGYAGISTYNSAPVIVNTYTSVSLPTTVITLQDDQYHYIHNNIYSAHPFINHSIQDFVSLQYTGSLDRVYNSFSVTVGYKIYAYDTTASALSPSMGTLTISYNATTKTLETYRSEGELNWGDSIIVQITSVSYTGTVPGDVELTSRIVVNRYWDLALNQSQAPTITQSANPLNNTLNLAWSYLPGAENYDLEWVLVSGYVPSGTPDFTQATRVNTTEQTYSINLAYDVGTIYYRVRGVGYMLPIDTQRMEAVWSPVQSYSVGDIDKQRNWTYSATYAEQGKRKEVMQFYDGTTRMRQAVTENNTQNTALISETMYDYEGRQGVTTLAAPDSADDSKLGFYKWLNLNTSNVPYSRKDFNVELSTSCSENTPNGLSTLNGSGNYYSDYNPLLSANVNMTIPDAGDQSTSYATGTFPFTETLYNSEGKIDEQAGPGITLSEGHGHTVQYFYANPLQSDLDKVMGNEAGDATHYQEKMTVDQNGQQSFSYTDMSGKVVATSIMGPSLLTQIDNLSESNSALTPYTSDLSSYNSFVAPDDAMEFSPAMAFLAKTTAPYTFSYTFNPSSISVSCIPFSTTIGYDLTISIYDQCGANVPITITSSTPGISIVGGTVVLTNLQTSQSINFTVSFPGIGVYYISKKLSLDQAALNAAVDAFSAAYPGHCAGFDSAEAQTAYFDSVNTNGCNTCSSGCGTPDTVNPCTALYQDMEQDMSPNGQYYDDKRVGVPANQPYSNNWLDSNLISPSYCGLITYVSNPSNGCYSAALAALGSGATWNDVRVNWQPCMAKYLVQYDPEYCRYLTCRKLETNSLTPDTSNSSLAFDQMLAENINYTWATSTPAVGAKYIDPLATCIGENMMEHDPFFRLIAAATYTSTMNSEICTSYNGGPPMWTAAYNQAVALYGTPTNNQVYTIFLSYYENEKQTIVRSWEGATTPYCQGFCDAGMVSTGIPNNAIAVSGAGCTTPAADDDGKGFGMRWPDNGNEMNNLANNLSNPATYTSTINTYTTNVSNSQYNVNSCNTASRTHIYNPSLATGCYTMPSGIVNPPDSIDVQVYIRSGSSTTDITCVSASIAVLPDQITDCWILPSTNIILQDIADAINNSTCNPGDYSATVTYSPHPTLNVYAPKAIGASPNTSPPGSSPTYLWMTDGNTNTGGALFSSFYSYGTSSPFDSGVTVSPCTPNGAIPNCLCTELHQLQQNYASFSNLPATYPTFEEYAICSLDTAYNLGSHAITGATIDTWLYNCNHDTNTSPTNHTGSPAVPAGLNCDPTPPCTEDSYDIASYDASVAFEQEQKNATATFQANYEAAAYNHAFGYGETINTTASTWECHYTLYYYDQAGNLARTVPPAGVAFLNQTGVNSVESFRATGSGSPGYPSHTKITTYNYNSLNSVIAENHTPDEGIISHWYDQANRLRFTRNNKQLPDSQYTYTKYDAQDRVVEVGLSNEHYGTGSHPVFYLGVKNQAFPRTDSCWQVTHTYYDAIFPGSVSALQAYFDQHAQLNLRSRVASVTYDSVGSLSPGTYNYATHYSYDELGYVTNMIRENTELTALAQNYKKIRYKYDQVSGNVNMADYQPGEWDRFIHRYEYDADNRITNAYTSTDSVIWDQDAKYFYYLHGPLARMEVGQEKVQGIDYAYTLQGWLKGVNSNVLSQSTDIGQDGEQNTVYWGASQPNIHSNVAQDAYGFVLDYFVNNTGSGHTAYWNDYSPIESGGTYPASQFYENSVTNSSGEDLYNGNIKQMQVAMENISNSAMSLLDNHYQYDQVNRLMQDKPYAGFSSTTSYSGGSNSSNYFVSNYAYDPDGNLQTLNRFNYSGTQIDNMTYTYESSPNLNRLDNVSNSLIGGSLPSGQASGNYTYDPIGELGKDVQGNIGNIVWSIDGKILYIRGYKTTGEPDIEFKYDGLGNCIEKIVKPKVSGVPTTQENWTYTYYTRDASGNIMAIYNSSMQQVSGTHYNETFTLAENPIYGSKRVGDFYQNLPLSEITFTVTGHNADSTVTMSGVTNVTLTPPGPFPISTTQPPIYTRQLGNKSYELDDHLGNVLMTVSDRKIPNGTVGGSVTYFNADVLSGNDYYPFGQLISARRSIYGNYRFAYNGKEKEDEIYSPTNAYDYGARMYDSRLGRFMSVDPVINKYAMLTPYQYASNTPIWSVDLDGLESVVYVIQRTLNKDNSITSSITAKKLKENGKLGSGAAVILFKDGTPYYMYGNETSSMKEFISHYEGYETEVYPSLEGGNATGGVGHKLTTDEVNSGLFKVGTPLSDKQIDTWYNNDWTNNSDNVEKNSSTSDQTGAKKDALADFSFNGLSDYLQDFKSGDDATFFLGYLKGQDGVLKYRIGQALLFDSENKYMFDFINSQSDKDYVLSLVLRVTPPAASVDDLHPITGGDNTVGK